MFLEQFTIKSDLVVHLRVSAILTAHLESIPVHMFPPSVRAERPCELLKPPTLNCKY